MLSDDSCGKDASEQENIGINDDSCLVTEVNEDNMLQLKRKGPNEESLFHGLSCSKGYFTNAFDRSSNDPQEDQPSKTKKPNNITVCEWPSLEKVLRFGVCDMDSRRMFIFIDPSPGSGKGGDYVLYLWVGKNFNHDCRSPLQTCNGPDDFDMKEVIHKVLIQTGLSADTHVEVVKQDEEPSKFLALLSSL